MEYHKDNEDTAFEVCLSAKRLKVENVCNKDETSLSSSTNVCDFQDRGVSEVLTEDISEKAGVNECMTSNDSDTSPNCSESNTVSSGLSKRQQKKLLKREQWLKRKPEKRAKEKAKLKQKKLEAKSNNIDLGPSRYYLKKCTMEKSNCNVHVAIDLSFDEYMNNKEIGKCIKQILRCYSLNRRAKNPMQLHLTDFNGKSKEEMTKHTGYENWDLNFHDESYLQVFKNEDVIYLTSESDNMLNSLENHKVYIIGGLVDHNSQKGLCYKLAQEKNLQHGQLPIGEYLEMKTRKVLTIDHVFEIILGVSEGKTWKDAFLSVLPARKGATEKAEDNEQNNKNSEDIVPISNESLKNNSTQSCAASLTENTLFSS